MPLHQMELSEIRSKVQSFTEEISKEYYLHGAGIKDKIDLNSIYKKYPRLFSRENIDIVNDAFINTSSDQDKKRRLAYFREVFYGEVAVYLNREKQKEFLDRESDGKITSGVNNEMSFRSSWVYMINEPDRKKRSSISNSREIFIREQLNPVLEDLYYAEGNYVRNNGFKNKIEMFETLSGIDLAAIRRLMNQFVNETEDLYIHYLSNLTAKELNIPVSDINRHDIAYWMRDTKYDIYFPADKLPDKIHRLVNGLGIDMNAAGNITYDLEARPNKSPRAFCSTVRVPQEVYLVLYPEGGVEDYFSFLHELGHALHFANTAPDLPFEYRWYGDFSLSEGYAMMFDHLLLKDLWINKFTELNSEGKRKFLERTYFKELAALRRYTAKINYELILNEDTDLKGMKELYAESLSKMTRIKYSKEDYLYDVDPYFYCARYLRAWMFQASIHSILNQKFGDNWFETKAAGDFLTDLWSTGQKYTADEILASIGGDLSVSSLVGEIKTVLEN